MKRRDLHNAGGTVVVNGLFGGIEHIVENQKVIKQGGANQQRGFQCFGRCVEQPADFRIDIFQKCVQMLGKADVDTDLAFIVRCFGKRAEVEPDNGFFQPFGGGLEIRLRILRHDVGFIKE